MVKPQTKPDNLSAPCPCGAALVDYAHCCARFIEHDTPAPSAEALMRSRYSAYVLKNEAYLRKTWHVSTRPADAILSDDDDTRWLSLTVKSHQNAPSGVEAKVEFIAKYKIYGKAHRLHEISDFVKENGRWYYLEGVHLD